MVTMVDCTAYNPSSPVPEPPRALNLVNEPVRVAERRADEKLHLSGWVLDFDVGHIFQKLFQDGDYPLFVPELTVTESLVLKHIVGLGATSR